jgi:hypothetical protein
LYDTKFREKLGWAGVLLKKKAQTLAEEKFEQFVKYQDQGMNVQEAYLQLEKVEQEELFDKWGKQFQLDERRVKIDERRADGYVKGIENESARLALKVLDNDRKAMSAVRGIVKNELNGDVLKGFMNPERGTFRVYNGLLAAWENYQKQPNSANMNGIFNMYQQLFDPATVREGDLELQKRGQGVFADIMATLQRFGGVGFVLEQETIDEMKSVADEFYARMLTHERENLDAYLDAYVTPEDAGAIQAYYNRLWGGGAPGGGQTGGGDGTAGDRFVAENFPTQGQEEE